MCKTLERSELAAQEVLCKPGRRSLPFCSSAAELPQRREALGAGDREDLRSFADVIDFDEQKIP